MRTPEERLRDVMRERDGWRLKYKALELAREPETQRTLENERRIRALEAKTKGAQLWAEKWLFSHNQLLERWQRDEARKQWRALEARD